MVIETTDDSSSFKMVSMPARIGIGIVVLTIVCLVVLFLSQTDHDAPSIRNSSQKEDASLRVLFIGNSYTYVNDLPNTFARLAAAGGHKVETGMAASGGWTLAMHANSPETLAKLRSSQWDFVVLQEQSEIPSMEASRLHAMYPAARTLVQDVRDHHAVPLFFMTWGHRAGLKESGLADYESMQAQLDQGYTGIAKELKVQAVPVGDAWRQVKRTSASLELWQADGSHPTVQGTFLAACVFYAAIFHEHAVGLTYSADLDAEIARPLQEVADEVVAKEKN